MRDQMRIPRVLQLIERYWLKVPDWRFGQLVENIRTFAGVDDLFFMEDDELMQTFEDFFETYTKDGVIQIK